MGIEHRGVRCIECLGLDLQKFPDTARNGFGWCSLAELPHFVSVRMARNCADFDPAPPEIVQPRHEWAERMPLFFAQTAE